MAREGTNGRLAVETLLASSASKQYDPDALLTQYEKSSRDLVASRDKLDAQKTINEVLGARAGSLKEANDKLSADLALAGDTMALNIAAGQCRDDETARLQKLEAAS